MTKPENSHQAANAEITTLVYQVDTLAAMLVYHQSYIEMSHGPDERERILQQSKDAAEWTREKVIHPNLEYFERWFSV